jgi:hypothetical protein
MPLDPPFEWDGFYSDYRANDFVPIYFLMPLPFLPLPFLHLPFLPLPSLDLAQASFARPVLAGRFGLRAFKIAFHIHISASPLAKQQLAFQDAASVVVQLASCAASC